MALDTELDVEDLQALVQQFKDIVREESSRDFPQHPPREQASISRSARCSTRGTPTARVSTAVVSGSRTTWALR